MQQQEVIFLLQQKGLQRVKAKGDEIWLCCPFHKEKTPSSHLSFEVGTFHCFGCGKKMAAHAFIYQFTGVKFLKGFISRSFSEFTKELKPDKFAKDYETYEKYCEGGNYSDGHKIFEEAFPLSSSKEGLEYLKNRLQERYTEIPFPVRFSKERNSLIFKMENIFIERLLNDVQSTTGQPPQGRISTARYINYSGKSIWVGYILPTCDGNLWPLIITEGLFDMFNAILAGFSAGAMLGHSLTPLKLAQISTMALAHSEVVYCPDNDNSGVQTTSTNLKKLYNSIQVPLSLMVIRGKKDLGECTEEEIKCFLGKRIMYKNILMKKMLQIEFK